MKRTLLALLVVALLSGCSVRSISNSGYDGGGGHSARGAENPFYKGELREFDVLGIDTGKEVTEEDIASVARREKKPLTLRKGDHLLLIQSGAMIPDQDMTENMERYFAVTVFSGIPEQGKNPDGAYSKKLRLAAAKAGIEKIVVYWGLLESGTRNLATRTVSWIPIVGWAVPDKAQELRIRLKVAVIDVKTGRWEIFVPKAFDDTAYSASINRKSSDQEQVSLLKTKTYRAAVEGMLARYTR